MYVIYVCVLVSLCVNGLLGPVLHECIVWAPFLSEFLWGVLQVKAHFFIKANCFSKTEKWWISRRITLGFGTFRNWCKEHWWYLEMGRIRSCFPCFAFNLCGSLSLPVLLNSFQYNGIILSPHPHRVHLTGWKVHIRPVFSASLLLLLLVFLIFLFSLSHVLTPLRLNCVSGLTGGRVPFLQNKAEPKREVKSPGWFAL